MTESSPDFRHGAEWVRADFHLHTIKEKHSSRKKLRDEWKNNDGELREDEFVKAYVERLEIEDIRVACITNHDSLDYGEYKAIAKRARQSKILVLPGMELSVQGGSRGIHALVIFNPDDLNQSDSRIADFLSGQFPGVKAEDTVTQDDLPTCFQKLERLGIGYFIIFAHAEADNGLLGALKGPNLEQVYKSCREIWDKRVLGFQKIRCDDHTLCQKFRDIPVPAKVEGSDPRDSICEVGDPANGICFLKISDLSFAAVKFALKDHLLRVSSERPEPVQRPRILSLEIDTKQKGLFGHFFSDDLNCLIGSRGAGKSLVIEALRWGLGKESGSGDDAYKSGLLDAFLQKGGKVTLTAIDRHGDEVQVVRHYLGKRDQSPPEMLVNQCTAAISVDTLFPGLLYFGQRDLGIRSEQSDTQLFDQLLGAAPEDLAQSVETRLRQLTKAVEQYQSARKAKEADDEYAYELNALTAKLKEFKDKGVEDKLQTITVFDSDLRQFRSFFKKFKDECTAVQSQQASWKALEGKFPEFKSAENSKAKEMMATAHASFIKNISLIDQLDQSLDSVTQGLDAVSELLETNKKSLQSRFAEILRSIDEPDLDLDGYRRMVSHHKQLTELRALSQSGSNGLSSSKRELISAGDQWLLALRAVTDHQNTQLAEINRELPEKLNLEIEALGDKDRFDQFIDATMKGSGFTTQAREKIVKQTASGFEIFKRWDTLAESELTPAMGAKLNEVLDAHLLEFITYATPDSRHITYDGKRINQLSLGKRAMALLVLLLSLKNYPIIIIDQPEDDLDNETIHRMIVEPLSKHKGQTQFIIATHNPNIPVLADAEQVIACYETSKGEYDHQTGSLDKAKTKTAIITIMEGGEAAFERRHEIYSQWTK